jgi:hypothetical protein
MAEHRRDADGPLLRPVKNNQTKRLDWPLDPSAVYKNVVRKYGLATSISEEVLSLCGHRCATAAANPLSHDSDIAKVQEWFGKRTFRPPDFMIGAIRNRKTALPLGLNTDGYHNPHPRLLRRHLAPSA